MLLFFICNELLSFIHIFIIANYRTSTLRDTKHYRQKYRYGFTLDTLYGVKTYNLNKETECICYLFKFQVGNTINDIYLPKYLMRSSQNELFCFYASPP